MIKQILIFFLSVGALFSQTSTPQQIKADFDFAQFRGSGDQTLLEIYYTIVRQNLTHIPSDDVFTGNYKITLNITIEGAVVSRLDWEGVDKVNSLDEVVAGQTINDVKTLLFRPGEYDFQLVITDLNNSSEYEYQKKILITDFNGENVHFSDIQFSHLIQKAENVNRFVKNGYQITPNPTLVYNTNQPILYYYFELYNLDRFENNSEFQLLSSISNQNGEVIKTLPEKKYNEVDESRVVAGNIYVGALFTGIYSFTVDLVNLEEKDTLSRSKQFYVYRPSDQLAMGKNDVTQQQDVNPYLFMSEEELDREFEYLRYAIDGEAADRWEELNLTAKREYINIYWIEKENVSPGFKKQFYERIEFANARYTIGSKDGWKTQTGRIILMYGIPDGIEKQTSVSSIRDYEIWTYEGVEGGAMFVFVNTTGYGELRLVHSTVMDEITDYDWQQRYLK